MNCTDCFKEQRSRNDILKQTQIDAQKFSEEKQESVAIIQDGAGFLYQVILKGEGVPPGTIGIVTPCQRSNDEPVQEMHLSQ